MVLVTASGCSQRILDFTMVSSKNTEMTIPSDAKGDRVKGKDTVMVFIIPWGTPSIKEAVDRAIESAGPEYDALIDGVIYYHLKAFIIGVVEYTVEGTPVISSRINMANAGGTERNLASSKPLLYHSRTKKPNDDAVAQIGVKKTY